MAVYMFVCMALLIPTLFSYKKQVSFDVMIFLFVPLFLVSAMRYDIGRDYDTYMMIFNHPEKIAVHEKGYMLLNDFARNYDFTLQAVVIIYAMFTLAFAFLFISENSKDKILSVFIFFTYTPFYLNTFNTMRQALAIYIFMYATRFIRSREFFKYLLFILIAAFFAHNSVLVTLPLYFVLNRRYRNKTKILLVGPAVLMSNFMDLIIKATPYAIYLLGTANDGLTPLFYLDIFLCLIIVLFMANTVEGIFYNIAFISFYVLGVGIIILKSSPIFTVIARINEYFLPSLIIMIPLLVQNFKRFRKIVYYACVVCHFCVFYFSITMRGVENQNVPYKTFFGRFNTGIGLDISVCILFLFFSLNMIGFLLFTTKRRAK